MSRMGPKRVGEKAACPACRTTCAVKGDGTLRKHPQAPEAPCVGSGLPVAAPLDGETTPPPGRHIAQPGERMPQGIVVRDSQPPEPKPDREPIPERAPATAPAPVVPEPGTHRQMRQRHLQPGAPVPRGYATVAVIALYPYDGSNGRTAAEEAALLFEDPGYLYEVLSAAPNEHVRVSLKVEDR